MIDERRLSEGDFPELSDLMDILGISKGFNGDFVLLGKDPVIRSPHRLGYATATSLGLNAILAAMIWGDRTEQISNAKIDIIDALHHLHDSHFIWQNGYKIEVGAEFVAINSFFRCKDGRMVYTIAGPPYMKLLNGYLDFFECSNNKESFRREFAKWDSQSLEEELAKAGLPGCVVRTEKEWLSHPVGKRLSTSPVISIDKIKDGEPCSYSENPDGPLTGIKVLDFTHVLAGPLCAQKLAEFGANVLHVTSPYHRDTMAQSFAGNFGKKNAYLDLNKEKDVAKARSLIQQADVFCESYRPGVVENFGMGVDDAKEMNPNGIVYLSISCYGHGHEWSPRPGFETIGQACTGFSVAEAKGDLNNPKMSPVFYLNDPLTGYFACSGVLAALRRRAIEGGSYHVRVSLVRTGMWVQELGSIPEPEYETQPETDDHPAKFETLESPFGKIKRLKQPVSFDNMPVKEQVTILPFGASLPEF